MDFLFQQKVQKNDNDMVLNISCFKTLYFGYANGLTTTSSSVFVFVCNIFGCNVTF